jgi:hypothetical protein
MQVVVAVFDFIGLSLMQQNDQIAAIGKVS